MTHETKIILSAMPIIATILPFAPSNFADAQDGIRWHPT